MHDLLERFVVDSHWGLLLVLIAASIAVLGKGADWLIEESVAISLRSGVPRVIVGATIVALGTTTPEAVVSVLAAVQGEPGLALGNAVGSIICDTGLILGLACLIRPLPIDPQLASRQGWVQFGSGVALVAVCFPWTRPLTVLDQGGAMPQFTGWVFLLALAVYMGWSIRLARRGQAISNGSSLHTPVKPVWKSLIFLALAIGLVLAASMVLIESATELAERLQVPPSIIAATLVAFGTSLPELIIVLTAAIKNQGELAVGNVIGADILNVLFVAGAAASVTPAGLSAEPHFFKAQFPAMLALLLIFRVGIWRAGKRPSDNHLTRSFGAVLVLAYVLVTVGTFFIPS